VGRYLSRQIIDLNEILSRSSDIHRAMSQQGILLSLSHSWHPVPLLLWAPEFGFADEQTSFGERACSHGGLGTIPATDIMPLALAHAGRLEKFGA